MVCLGEVVWCVHWDAYKRWRERDNSTPGHWSAPDPRGQEFWPLGSSQQCAHRAAGRLGLLHSVYKHIHTHTHTYTHTHTHTAQWYNEWYVRESQHVHTHMDGLRENQAVASQWPLTKGPLKITRQALTVAVQEKSFPLLPPGNFSAPCHSNTRSFLWCQTCFKWLHSTLKRLILDIGLGKLTSDSGILTYNLFQHCISQQ